MDSKRNIIDECIYVRVNGSIYINLVLYVNNILLTANDTDILLKDKIDVVI